MPKRDLPLQLGDKPWQEVTASPAVERHLIETAAPFAFSEFGFDDDGNLDGDLDDELDDDVVPVLPGELDDDDDDEVDDPLRYGRR